MELGDGLPLVLADSRGPALTHRPGFRADRPGHDRVRPDGPAKSALALLIGGIIAYGAERLWADAQARLTRLRPCISLRLSDSHECSMRPPGDNESWQRAGMRPELVVDHPGVAQEHVKAAVGRERQVARAGQPRGERLDPVDGRSGSRTLIQPWTKSMKKYFPWYSAGKAAPAPFGQNAPPAIDATR